MATIRPSTGNASAAKSAGKTTTAKNPPRRRAKDGVLDLKDVPSSPTQKRARATVRPDRSPKIDLQRALELAQYGLSPQEIAVQLDIPGDLSLAQEAELQEALRRGRALGLAAIKKARYEAALGGKVTAQSELLRMYNGDGDSEAEVGPAAGAPLRVRRIILDAPGEADPPSSGPLSGVA